MALRIRTEHPFNVVEGDTFIDVSAAEVLLNDQAAKLQHLDRELADARSALREALDVIAEARGGQITAQNTSPDRG